ncbi:N-acetylmuramoyl-L-alanine amidase [Desulfonauticus submarinus]
MDIIKRRFFIITLIIFSLVISANYSIASLSTSYTKTVRSFIRLQKNYRKAKYIDNWLKLKRKFLKIYKANPRGKTAPKSLYYIGRVYEELGKRSRLTSDFIKSIDYYRRLILHFPKHSWADDAQFHIANIYYKYLKDTKQAYIEFLKVSYNYPKGDMKYKAEKILKKMDEKNLKKIKISSSPIIGNKKITSKNKTTRLTNIRHWSSDEYTRVVLDIEDKTNYFYKLLSPDKTLQTPYRLFIDLENTTLSPKIPKETIIADGILKKVRVAQHTNKEARVVLDIESLKDYRLFSLTSPFRVVIDIYGEPKKTVSSPTQVHISKKLRKQIASQNLIEQLGLKVKTIMLDAGHGGKDPGAISHGIREKDINLKMVKILGKMLAAKGFKVLYTRTRDVFIPLEERTALANSQKADLFISIHCNAHRNPKVRGLEIYYLNLTRSKDALRVAARENAVSEKSISDLQLILTELMLNSKISESRDLAKIVKKKCLHRAKKHYPSLKDNGVREAPFYVLMGAKMPAILIELGYITNWRDRKKLTSTRYLQEVAKGIVEGILRYKKDVENIAKFNDLNKG